MRTAKPGKIPGFFASRSRENSMTLAERLIQKGALEVAREIACRLRDIGWPLERIQEVTGLSGEELKKLFPDEQ
ncbi:hypothetical protein ED284_13570 [Shigella sonnei]|uniref:hypothetical protein n=1 Tax=Shigella sonnei TaxID=624 RepID=UPI000FC074C7|nr:hypothetical protein [Shigella sonnei]EFW1014173.1 hypothetical protein [Shigella flexneri]ELJ5203172.1 hypothetical protein [Escherichia coli]EAA6571393.1 hypothetical protein [Shigella sonnei]EAB5372371.1 hypothetical protein [Shigella sonnei]EAB6952305.1 hypothetical protein [Shigella sonnei]